MIQTRTHQPPDTDNRPKWFNSPVSFHDGTLSNIGRYMPEFERRAFGLTQPGKERTRINERLDTIVRRPIGKDPSFVPMGVKGDIPYNNGVE